jgi:hypothetical protein
VASKHRLRPAVQARIPPRAAEAEAGRLQVAAAEPLPEAEVAPGRQAAAAARLRVAAVAVVNRPAVDAAVLPQEAPVGRAVPGAAGGALPRAAAMANRRAERACPRRVAPHRRLAMARLRPPIRQPLNASRLGSVTLPGHVF